MKVFILGYSLFMLWLLTHQNEADAQIKSNKKEVIYEYKKYDKIDLGSMEIDGKIVVPADLTVIDQDTAMDNRPLYDRKHFLKEMQRDLISF